MNSPQIFITGSTSYIGKWLTIHIGLACIKVRAEAVRDKNVVQFIYMCVTQGNIVKDYSEEIKKFSKKSS